MKKIFYIFLTFIISLSVFPLNVFAAQADGTNGSTKSASTTNTYTAPALLTTGIKVEADICPTIDPKDLKKWREDLKGKNKNTDQTMPGMNKDDKDSKFLQMLLSPVNRTMEDTFGNDKNGKEGVISKGCEDEFSFTKHILKITSPVNVTPFKSLMTFTRYIQLFTMAFLILFIVGYGFQYVLGKRDLADPMRFGYKVGAVVLAVMLAPRIIQDLLNLNNIIVYYISSMPIPGSFAGAAAAGSAGLGISASLAIANLLTMTVTSLLTGVGLFFLLLFIILIILILIPLIKITVWWYTRLAFILLMTVFSPVFFLMFLAESTAGMAKNFFKQLVVEIFSQVFVTIAFYFFVSVLMSFDQLGDVFGIGFLGMMLFLYVMVNLLAEIPSIVTGWLGGAGSIASYKQMAGAISMGVGAAIGAGMDKGMKKINAKAAQNKFKKENAKQQEKINSAFENKQAFDAMNDPNGENRAEKVMEKLKADVDEKTGNKVSLAKKGEPGAKEGAAAGKRKNANQLVGAGAESTKPVNQEAINQAKNDNIAFGLHSEELKGYGNDTKKRILEGLKNGTLNKDQATDLLKADRQARGENPFMAMTNAVEDRAQMERKHGIKFGEKNSNVQTGNEMKLASPVSGVNPYTQPSKETLSAVKKSGELKPYSSETRNKIVSGLKNGSLTTDEATNLMRDDRMARGENAFAAMNGAVDDRKKLEQNHGIKFAEKTSQAKTGNDSVSSTTSVPVFDARATELNGYGDETKQRILQGAKDGTLNANSATKLLEADRLARGENSYKATMGAVEDRKAIEQNHGITFGQANPTVNTERPGISGSNSEQAKGLFTSSTMSAVQNGLENGTMHRSQAVSTMADDLRKNKGMSAEKAASVAESRMQAFESVSKSGLGYEGQSQINKLASSGDLTQNHVRDIAKKDAMYHKGLTDHSDIQRHVDTVMSNTNAEEIIGTKSNRDSAKIEKAPALNFGNGVKTRGGVSEGAKATTGERKGVTYEIPDTPILSGGRTPSTSSSGNPSSPSGNPSSGNVVQEVVKENQKPSQHQIDNKSQPVKQKGEDINPADRGVVADTVIGSNSHIAEIDKKELDLNQIKNEIPTNRTIENHSTTPNETGNHNTYVHTPKGISEPMISTSDDTIISSAHSESNYEPINTDNIRGANIPINNDRTIENYGNSVPSVDNGTIIDTVYSEPTNTISYERNMREQSSEPIISNIDDTIIEPKYSELSNKDINIGNLREDRSPTINNDDNFYQSLYNSEPTPSSYESNYEPVAEPTNNISYDRTIRNQPSEPIISSSDDTINSSTHSAPRSEPTTIINEISKEETIDTSTTSSTSTRFIPPTIGNNSISETNYEQDVPSVNNEPIIESKNSEFYTTPTSGNSRPVPRTSINEPAYNDTELDEKVDNLYNKYSHILGETPKEPSKPPSERNIDRSGRQNNNQNNNQNRTPSKAEQFDESRSKQKQMRKEKIEKDKEKRLPPKKPDNKRE